MTASDPEHASGAAAGRAFPRRRNALGLRAYIALLLALAIAPLGAVGVLQTVLFQRENDALRDEAYVSATIAATAQKTRLIAENFGLLASVAAILPMTGDRRSCNRLLATLARERAGVSAATAVDEAGAIVCRSAPGLGAKAAGGPALARRMAEDPRPLATMVPDWRPEGDGESASPSAPGGDSVLVMAYPLAEDGRYAGFVTLVAPRRLVPLLEARPMGEDIGRRALAEALFDQQGTIYAITDGPETPATADEPTGTRREGRAEDWLPDVETLAEWAAEPAGEPRRHVPADGMARVYVVLPVIEGGLNTLVAWPVAEAERAAASRFAISALFPIAMWTVAVAVAFLALNTLVLRNVLSLAWVMHAFAIGKRDARVGSHRWAPSELATLGETFNHLADRIVADEQIMAETIEEKNTLLKEVYHRVKNNLQLIVSMTNLQIREARDETERQTLRRLQGRVQGLALVHQRLYEARSLSAVRLDLLLEDLLRRIREVQSDEDSTVQLSIDTEPLTFDPDDAVPLALFASEAIENAFKHGIGPGGDGQVGIALARTDEDRLVLEVWNSLVEPDPAAAEDAARESIIHGRGGLGLRLLEAFARQLGGRMAQETTETRYRVTLDIPMPAREGA